jgi:hypothetical protein
MFMSLVAKIWSMALSCVVVFFLLDPRITFASDIEEWEDIGSPGSRLWQEIVDCETEILKKSLDAYRRRLEGVAKKCLELDRRENFFGLDRVHFDQISKRADEFVDKWMQSIEPYIRDIPRSCGVVTLPNLAEAIRQVNVRRGAYFILSEKDMLDIFHRSYLDGGLNVPSDLDPWL